MFGREKLADCIEGNQGKIKGKWIKLWLFDQQLQKFVPPKFCTAKDFYCTVL